MADPKGEHAADIEQAILQGIIDPNTAPDVLESYVYAFGIRFANTGQYADPIADLIKSDTANFPRQAAWLALARIDRDKFLSLAGEYAQSANAWDQWGQLRGRLELGDYSDLSALWQWGARDDADRRHHAARVFREKLAPLLEAVGQWPAELDTKAPHTWQPEDFTQLQTATAGLDLVALAADCQPQFERSKPIRSMLGKVTGGRNRIKRWLFGE
jgi:hypothetical protein